MFAAVVPTDIVEEIAGAAVATIWKMLAVVVAASEGDLFLAEAVSTANVLPIDEVLDAEGFGLPKLKFCTFELVELVVAGFETTDSVVTFVHVIPALTVLSVAAVEALSIFFSNVLTN